MADEEPMSLLKEIRDGEQLAAPDPDLPQLLDIPVSAFSSTTK